MRILAVCTLLALVFHSCQKSDDEGQVVSQRFLHKYGFDLTPTEWQERQQDGQVITKLENGVSVTNSYSNGILHGNTSYTFPNTTVVETLQVYDQGTLIKQVSHDRSGIPLKEELFEFDNRKIITLWDEKGAPISIEEYENDLLVKGQYFLPDNDLESSVEAGNGMRVVRNREGLLISKDKMENGQLVFRTSFHENGQIQSECPFFDYQLHGKMCTFSSAGTLITEQNWTNGKLDGMSFVYRNEVKAAEVPYFDGKKHGVEKRFDKEGNIICEVHWDNDLRHGSSRYYEGDDTSICWFFRDKEVSIKRFHELEFHEKMIAELRDEKSRISEQAVEDSVAF